jgi:hypothetical protein
MYPVGRARAVGGPVPDAERKKIARALGPDAAEMIHAAVTFNVTGVRPLAGMGRGREKPA